MTSSLVTIGAVKLAPLLSNIPPTGALFSAFLGYNPVDSILSSLPPSVVATIPAATKTTLTGTTWFPSAFANAFMPSLKISFYVGAAFCALAALLSALRGETYIPGMDEPKIKSKTNPKNEKIP